MAKKPTDKKTDNLALWNAVEEVPTHYLKPINFGPLKGKSDINPMWRLKTLTEHFGPCGQGWWYEVLEHFVVEGNDEEGYTHSVMFVTVALHIKGQEGYITGEGGAKLAVWDKNGMHMNDEAFKMATTDALGVACKAMGFGSAIYEGRLQGSKYQPLPEGPEKKKPGKIVPTSYPKEEKSNVPKKATKAEKDKILKVFTEIGTTQQQLEEVIECKFADWHEGSITALRAYYATAKKAYDEFHNA